MTSTTELLGDSFDRIRGLVRGVLDGADRDKLVFRVDPQANTIAWLVWHLARIQDDHIADAMGVEQLWPAWADRFDLPFSLGATGYGQSADDVAAVDVDASLLRGYFDAVADRTGTWIDTLSDADLDRIVDEDWDPPVTLAVRLVSVISDDLQHAGQANFIAGVFDRSK